MPIVDLHDEHGVPTADAPLWLRAEDAGRWGLCVEIAAKTTGQPAGHPENRMFAESVFRSDVPTDTSADASTITESALSDRLAQIARRRRRNRLGRFAAEFRVPPPRSPGAPRFTRQQIHDAGLDRYPTPGAAAKRLLGNAPSTASLHRVDVPDRHIRGIELVHYSHERSDLHDSIVEKFLADKVAPEGRKPVALFTAGGPSSGKTTFMKKNPEMSPPQQSTVRIDPDDIKEAMPEYQQLKAAGDPYAAMAVHDESGDIAAKLMLEAIHRGLDIEVDGTGNHDPGEFVEKLKFARDSGYDVDLLYVNAPTDTAISWAIDRATETGRLVPVPVIRQRHRRVSQVFIDEVLGLDWLRALNVIEQGNLVATQDEDHTLHVVDRRRYAAFIAKKDETDG